MVGEILLAGVVTALTVLTFLVGLQLYKILCSLRRILQILQKDLEVDRRRFWQSFIAAQERSEEEEVSSSQVEVGLKQEVISSRRSFRKDGKQLN